MTYQSAENLCNILQMYVLKEPATIKVKRWFKCQERDHYNYIM